MSKFILSLFGGASNDGDKRGNNRGNMEVTDPKRIFEAFLLYYYMLTPERWSLMLKPLEEANTMIHGLVKAMKDNSEEPPYRELEPLDPRNHWARIADNWVLPHLKALRRVIHYLEETGDLNYNDVVWTYANSLGGRGFGDQLMYEGKSSTIEMSGGITYDAILKRFENHLSAGDSIRRTYQHFWRPVDTLDQVSISKKMFDWYSGGFDENGAWEDFYRQELPATLLRYFLQTDLQQKSGEICKRTGVWMSGEINSCAEFFIIGQKMEEAVQYVDKRLYALDLAWNGVESALDNDGNPVMPASSWSSTTWTYIEQIQPNDCPEGGWKLDEILPKPLSIEFEGLRCECGQPCPKTGYWFTPARAQSRGHFEQGQPMPAFESSYGNVIWQWDINQN